MLYKQHLACMILRYIFYCFFFLLLLFRKKYKKQTFKQNKPKLSTDFNRLIQNKFRVEKNEFKENSNLKEV